jgi:hypothetical protein
MGFHFYPTPIYFAIKGFVVVVVVVYFCEVTVDRLLDLIKESSKVLLLLSSKFA